MVGKIASMGLQSGLKIETTLDPAIQPFLHDHQIDGTPVLPGVMGIEAFAEAALVPASRLACRGDRRREFPGAVQVLSERTAHGDGRRQSSIRRATRLLADCRLTGSRLLPNQTEPQVTTHFTAQVRLTKQTAEAGDRAAAGLALKDTSSKPPTSIASTSTDPHTRWWSGRGGMDTRIVGLMAKDLPANHHPSELPTLMAPRLIELCFQTAGLWEMGAQGRMGLPQHIDRVSRCYYRHRMPADDSLIRCGHS